MDTPKNVLDISSYEEAKGKELDVYGKKLYIKDIKIENFMQKINTYKIIYSPLL